MTQRQFLDRCQALLDGFVARVAARLIASLSTITEEEAYVAAGSRPGRLRTSRPVASTTKKIAVPVEATEDPGPATPDPIPVAAEAPLITSSWTSDGGGARRVA